MESYDLVIQIDEKRANELIEKLARFIVDRKLAPAAILAIESLRPLNFLGSQLLYTISPFAEVFFDPKEYREIAALVENKQYVKLLVDRIDVLDEETYREERKKSQLRRKQKKVKRRENFNKHLRKMNIKITTNRADRTTIGNK